jgi:hypothetical protein
VPARACAPTRVLGSAAKILAGGRTTIKFVGKGPGSCAHVRVRGSTSNAYTEAWSASAFSAARKSRMMVGVRWAVGRALERPAVPCDLLRAGLDADPDGLALISADTRLTWRALDDLSGRLAGNLLALGLEPGDRVASLMPNRPALVVHYLACFKAGLVATPLNYRYMAPEIDHALQVSKARALLAHAERGQDLAASELAGHLPLGRISYGAGDGQGPTFEDLVAGDEPPAQLAPPSSSAPAVMFFTSGSTGRPKGVTHTHETLGWMLAAAAAGLELTPADRLLAGSSLSHLGVLGHDVGDTPARSLTGRRPPSAVEMFMSSLLGGLHAPP